MGQVVPDISVGVVIPAAGSGQRLGGPRKQFRLLGGRPLLIQTASIFQSHASISTIVLVVPNDDVRSVGELGEQYGLDKISAVVQGGSTRQESVRRGLEALPVDTGIVITHDAVRPFVAANEISRLIAQTNDSGAAVVATSVSDTLVRSVDGEAGNAIPREGLFRMLTPQAFRRDILLSAHYRATSSGNLYTDEVTLVRANGQRVMLVEGSAINIKITTKSDWELAEMIWPAWSKR